MIRVLAAGAIAAAVLTGAADTRGERELAATLKDRVAGTPVDCVRVEQTQNPSVIDDRTIVFRDGRRVWVNRLEAACPGLDWDTILVSEIYGSQYCRNDHFRTIDRGSRIPGPTCRYGAFTPYTKPKS